jgi:hypothetical protein
VKRVVTAASKKRATKQSGPARSIWVEDG